MLRRPKAGRILKALLAGERKIPLEELRKSARSPLAHPARRLALEFLCERPGSAFTAVAARTGTSPPSTKWHLDKLVEKGYVTNALLGGKSLYYPAGFAVDGDLPLLSALNAKYASGILSSVLEKPGITVWEMGQRNSADYQRMSRCAGMLAREQIIAVVLDGRKKKYFPTEKFPQAAQAMQKRMPSFRQGILSLMESDGLKPKLASSSQDRFTVSIWVIGERHPVVLNTNPFQTILRTMHEL